MMKKGIRVRYKNYNTYTKKTYFCVNDEMMWDATIPVVFAAYITQVPSIQEMIEVEYQLQHEGMIESGHHREAMEDLNTLFSHVKRDTAVDTDNETFFKIDFLIRNCTDANKIEKIVSIEGVSIYASFDYEDEYGFPKQDGKYGDCDIEMFDDISIPLPRFYYKEAGNLQGILDL